jgi:uncharacterized Tic20 family protein
MDSKEQTIRTWSMLCHIGALAGIIFPILTVLGPVILWQIKKNEIPQIDPHGKEAVNFQLTVFVANLAIGILLAIIWGGFGFGMFYRSPLFLLGGFGLGFGIGGIFIFLNMLISLAGYIFAVVAGIKANNGEAYKYPFSIKFIK